LPLYGYAVEDMRFSWLLGVKALFGFSPAEDRFEGFQPRHTQWTGEFDEFKVRHAVPVVFEIEPAGVLLMEEVGDICRTNRIKLVLVYSPVYRAMRELEANRAEVFAEFERVAHEKGAELWDFSDSPLCSSKENFYNSQHLNATGAEEFTRELCARMGAEGLFKHIVASNSAAVSHQP
jgi:hypothetical protein